MTEVTIVGAVTLPTLLIPSAVAAWAGLAVMGPSLTTNFDAASSDGDEIVTWRAPPGHELGGQYGCTTSARPWFDWQRK